jgi:hypothetical protein
MTITRDYARRLVRTGRAREDGLVSGGAAWPEYPHYVAITRHDTHSTDHYPATERDEDRLTIAKG